MNDLMNFIEVGHRLKIFALDLGIEKWDRIALRRKEYPDNENYELFISEDTCCLCRVFFIHGSSNPCKDCPYALFHGMVCDSGNLKEDLEVGHWLKFRDNPTVSNAIAMRDALQAVKDALLEEYNE